MYYVAGDFNLNFLDKTVKKVEDFLNHKQTNKRNSHCNRPHPHKHFCGWNF